MEFMKGGIIGNAVAYKIPDIPGEWEAKGMLLTYTRDKWSIPFKVKFFGRGSSEEEAKECYRNRSIGFIKSHEQTINSVLWTRDPFGNSIRREGFELLTEDREATLKLGMYLGEGKVNMERLKGIYSVFTFEDGLLKLDEVWKRTWEKKTWEKKKK